ncbi:hypothetical protein ASE04_18705 [Rhizobium sp. Root708]|uniref:hypothetical protein n=1 Tax=Rhizobium sp. Root708 TaxID=1736592 RepID=UPI0006FD0F50|nr:hypothetical protein [Rhizobium sp. Root708]KRB49209.1 hypothetical protein ASE04_18705 [Rhizobium sp. Root708]
MQITDTNVTKGNDGKVTVEFNGEGGEFISVRMAAPLDLQDEASVHHAKELMVQVATFGIPDEAFVLAQASAEENKEGIIEDVPEATPTTGSFSSPNTVG